MKRVLALTIIVMSLVAISGAKESQQTRPFTIDDLLRIRRVSDPQISPDGRWVAYTIADTDKPANKRVTQIYLISTDGGEPRQLTNEKQSSSSPRWSPDGKRIAFVSNRDGQAQVWTVEVSDGRAGALKKITSISTGADGPIWSPDGK